MTVSWIAELENAHTVLEDGSPITSCTALALAEYAVWVVVL
jgi:hypothetical protein